MGFPAPRTLQRLANSVEFTPGVCGPIKKELKVIVNKMKDPRDKVCFVQFDEVAIHSGIFYNESKDRVDGFVDMDDGIESTEIADHALVFMVQGLYTNWKQPFAFFFTKGTVSASDLKRILTEEVIPALQEIGLIVKATVCDRGATNVKAIKQLIAGSPEDDPYFIVNGEKIYALFDNPHLLKVTRNHLLDKVLIRSDGTVVDIDHIKDILKYDINDKIFRATKLADVHTNPGTKAKMRVKYAAQLFSNSVKAALLVLERYRRKKGLPSGGHANTAQFVGFMDKLFDSVNGYTKHPLRGKPYYRYLTDESGHFEFWAKAKEEIKSWRFRFKKMGPKTA